MNKRREMPTVIQTYQRIKEDYTVNAEEVIKNISRNRNTIKTNQIRNIYALILPFFDKLNYGDAIDVESAKRALRKVKIKIAYQIGRDEPDKKGNYRLGIKPFNDYSNILDLIDVVINSEDFINDLKLYCDYFEALVAYHRYYLGDKK